ncbi:MAG: fatty acid desaturase [Lentisphaerae bacterium]|nr:fatty acid desaturase [Lentisphaerota bacterium]
MANIHDSGTTIKWYRTPIPRETLTELNRRSDLKGMLQSGGILLLLATTGTATLWSAFVGAWGCTPLLLFLHGAVGTFNINAVHELCHNSVFKSPWLNACFLRIFGFIGWSDWVHFNTSHANHHRYTLHPPRDGEVVLPIQWLSRKQFWQTAIWTPLAPYNVIRSTWRKARGQWEDPWTLTLFPPDRPEPRRKLMRWNQSVLIGHTLIIVGSIVAAVLTQRWAWLLVPYVVSFSFTYGGWLFYLCNNTQHVGLTDKVPDFRLCCRSMKLPRIVSFLYWHMEYHTEHHMYAAVPCYNLRRLSQLVSHDLPVPKGLVGTWREIGMILARQQEEPDYQYQHPLPASAASALMGDREHEVAAGAAQPDPGAICDE